jgi:ribosome recycling factor
MAVPNETSLSEAVHDLQTRKFTSIRAAARFHHVDRVTLQRRLQGGLSHKQQHKQRLLLSEEQEKLLKSWILDSEAAGHPPTHGYIRELVGLLSRQAGGPSTIGHNWIQRFIKRHPDIKSKVGKKIEAERVRNTSPEALAEWYNLFDSIRRTYQVKLSNIWNMDETGIALGVCNNQWVIGRSSSKSSYVQTPENREWVSIIETISATGACTRPVVLFKGQMLQSSWFLAEDCPDWLYGVSTNGWTSNEIGLRWLDEVFLPETAMDNETRILLIDGYGSHTTSQFMTKCIEHNVKVVYLIPHSSHVLQPLDLACFSLIKSRYRDQIANLSRFEDSAHIKKIRFIQYYDKAREIGLTPSIIRSGWRAAGIEPWDPLKVITSSQVPQQQAQDITQTPQRKSQLAIELCLTTPQNRRDFDRLVDLLLPSIESQRSTRMVLKKASKAMDRLHHHHVIQSQTITAYETQIQELKNKRKKKATIDSNEGFASMERIIATKAVVALQQPLWDEQKAAQDARNVSNALQANQMAAHMFEFHQLDGMV